MKLQIVIYTLGVSVRSIEQWEESYAARDCISPPQLSKGHPKLLMLDMIENMQILLQEDPTLLSDELKEWLTLYHDQPISTMALHMTLQDLTLMYK